MQGGVTFDGFTTIVAQDADTHPSFLPPGYVAESVNRTFRGGINRTRPSIRNINLIPGDGESETIVDDIRQSNFQGAKEYRAVKSTSADGIVCSFGGVIYFIQIVGTEGKVYKLIDGNDPSMMHTWFCQAEDWMYIQNGYQNPIAWDGVVGNPATRLNPADDKMPIGTIMAYAFGRVFVSDRYNQITASDIIFGNGFTDTSNTQNFTETTYWAEGGSFSTPASMGNITAMEVMPIIASNSRGQGELVVLCENGAFTLDVSIPRLEWKDAQIQRVSLIGRGCFSPYTALVNSELWFRSSDGWAFYSNSQGDFNRYFVLRKLSREVDKWVAQDTPWLKQFASTIFWNNYVISTVSPDLARINGSPNLTRFHRGMVVLDLDMSASPSPDASVSFRWNGLWTGVRPCQLVTANIQGDKRAFAFSFDSDNQNRLYEFTKYNSDDYGPGGTKEIESFFITGRYGFAAGQRSNSFMRKKLTGAEIWVSEIASKATISADYRADSEVCWHLLQDPFTLGCGSCQPLGEECEPKLPSVFYKRLTTTTPSIKECNPIEKIPSVEGSEFQLKVMATGVVTFDRIRVAANVKDNEASLTGICASDDEACIPQECCPEEYFTYSIV